MRSFLLSFLVFNVGTTGALLVLLAYFEVPFDNGHLFTVLYFLVLGIALHYWQESALTTDSKLAVQRYMTGMVFKMLFTLLVLLVAVVKMPKSMVLTFTIPFIVLYLAHLAFSTVQFSALLRRPMQ